MSSPYYRFFPGDYLRDTRFLSLTQHGAYHLLIHEYMTNGPLPNDLARLHRIVGAQSVEERAAVETVLTEFFLLDGPMWRHKRCDKERGDQQRFREKQRANANKRWSATADATADATAMPPHMPRQCLTTTTNTSSTYVEEGAAGAAPSDIKKAAFDAGVALLAVERGEKEARSLVGRMRKALGDADVLELIRQARAASEPVEWLMKAASRAAISKRISDANGGAKVVALDDGRYRCGPYFYSRKGAKEVAI